MKTSSKIILRVVLYGGVILLLAAIVIPNFVKARVTESPWSCQVNLLQLDGALHQHASEKKLAPGATVPLEDLRHYYGSDHRFELHTRCLAGGNYPQPLIVEQEPTCSLQSTNPALHAQLWDQAWKERVRELNRRNVKGPM